MAHSHHHDGPNADTHDHGHHHDHGHDHERGSSLWSRFTHAASELVGGDSHDAADQVDEALEADAAGRRALLISLAGLAVTAAIQAVVVVLSGSVALLGDTLHNVADAFTAVPLLIAFRLAQRPPTKRYTYGYGRAEDLGGLFVIAMITLSAVLAAYEAIDRLIHPRTGVVSTVSTGSTVAASPCRCRNRVARAPSSVEMTSSTRSRRA
jgi:Co/Zn/Cd efflux system component